MSYFGIQTLSLWPDNHEINSNVMSVALLFAIVKIFLDPNFFVSYLKALG